MPLKVSRSASRYLKFVREQPCCSCQKAGPSDPHHYGPGGMALKADDLHTVPLCRRCHDRFHDTRCLPLLNVLETKAHLWETQAKLLVAWYRMTAPTGRNRHADVDDVF